MKLAALFSGGKDSCLAIHKAMQEGHEIVGLITIKSKNPHSYMFHTPNIHLAEIQAKAIGLPLLVTETEGKKEAELKDLKNAIKEAKTELEIEGIVTGALFSKYQASRIQKICDELGLKCVNPLWQKSQLDVLKEIIDGGFEVIISGIFAYGIELDWLGKKIDDKFIKHMQKLEEKYKINPAGEGGEIETTTLYAPFFKKRIKITDSEIKKGENEGVFVVKKAVLE